MLFGIHLYISIANLSSIAEDAEQHGDIRKVFFSMDLLLSELDTWTKNHCPSSVYIEKLTGSRIHFVLNTGSSTSDHRYFWDIVNYAYGLLNELNDATKLASLSADYQMNMGADYGSYVNSPINHKNIKEENSIGNPANQAAKIQSMAETGWLYLSADLYRYLGMNMDNIPFYKIPETLAFSLAKKYPDLLVYKIRLGDARRILPDSRSFFAQYKNPFDGFSQKLTEETLSSYTPTSIDQTYRFGKTTNNPKLIAPGYVLYSDIRGSTRLVAAYADKPEFKNLVSAIMGKIESMIDSVLENDLDHVQVQGDRESAMLVVSNDMKSAARKLIKCAFLLQGASFIELFESRSIDPQLFPLSVGVGVSYGRFYRSSIGTRADSDNLLLGAVVNDADDAEDKGASKPNVIALTKDAYNAITSCGDSDLAAVVKRAFALNDSKTYYVSVVSKDGYLSLLEQRSLDRNSQIATARGDKPWAP